MLAFIDPPPPPARVTDVPVIVEAVPSPPAPAVRAELDLLSPPADDAPPPPAPAA